MTVRRGGQTVADARRDSVQSGVGGGRDETMADAVNGGHIVADAPVDSSGSGGGGCVAGKPTNPQSRPSDKCQQILKQNAPAPRGVAMQEKRLPNCSPPDWARDRTWSDCWAPDAKLDKHWPNLRQIGPKSGNLGQIRPTFSRVGPNLDNMLPMSIESWRPAPDHHSKDDPTSICRAMFLVLSSVGISTALPISSNSDKVVDTTSRRAAWPSGDSSTFFDAICQQSSTFSRHFVDMWSAFSQH